MFQEALGQLFQKQNLTAELMSSAMQEILAGQISPIQIAAFLTALRIKGETPLEIFGAVESLRSKATPIHTQRQNVIDTCGTGGDGSGTFNISTASALVAAGAGATVAKHGNKAISSACGSANVLQELGVNIEISPEKIGACIDEVGIGFLFAANLHQSMKYVGPVRQELKQRTLFNLLGPMLNPAQAKRQVIGVYQADIQITVAEVLKKLGSTHVIVVHSEDGLDEISLSAPTRLVELKEGTIHSYIKTPQDLGFSPCTKQDLQGGNASTNAKIIYSILEGKKGPPRDVVLLNAGAALYVSGIASTLEVGIQKAQQSIDSGAAQNTLKKLIEFTKV